MKKTIILVLLLFFTKGIYAQYTIAGNIIDSSNKLRLFGSSIQVENSNNKTITNEEGDFEVKLATLPAVIIVSHVGYKKARISVNNTEYLQIKLVQEPIQLAEVRVGNPAVSILNAVVEKARLIETQKQYFKAFYRRISTNDGSINRIQEVFMNVSWGVEGVVEWQPVNIRYAKVNPLPSRNIYFSNFLYSAIYHKFDGFAINSIEIGRGYTLKVKNYINIGSPDEIAVIAFESIDKKKYGSIYVRTKKDQLLKIVETRKENAGRGFKRTFTCEVNFKENIKEEAVFDNIFITETTGRSLDFRKAIEKAWLYFQDEIASFENGSTIYPAFSKSDAKIMLSVPYNPNYWRDNVPFPATYNIKKIIEKMEQSDKFMSNFN
jgi:hypothetical protein